MNLLTPAKRRGVAVVALAVLGAAGHAGAQVAGFGGSAGTGWTANSNTAGVPTVSGSGDASDVLTLTTAANSEATSYWFNTQQSVGNFSANFSYTPTYTGTPADGITLTFQNAGTNVLGGGGGALGYSGIGTSAAYEINIFSGASGGPGVAVGTSAPNAAIPGTYPLSPVVLPTSGHTYNVSLGYDGTTLFSTVTDTSATGAAAGPVTYNARVDIPSLVGSANALVGFTGGTGGLNANQAVSNFTYNPGAFAAPAATFKPVGVTGFTQQMVVPASATGGTGATLPGTVTATVDGGTAKTGATFYEQGFNANAPVSGLPVGGTVFYSQSDSTHQFVLQPASGNDAVMLDSSNTAGTLNLTSPGRYSAFSLLLQNGNGGSNLNVTVHFNNGSTESHTIASPDWFGGSLIAWLANGRVAPTTAGLDAVNGQNPRLYQADFTLTDTTDLVTSIDLNWAGTGGNRTDIFGLSGVAVPEPASLSVLALGGLGLLARRRRARV